MAKHEWHRASVPWRKSRRMSVFEELKADLSSMTQRQTVISQFYQLDRLVVEGGLSVCAS